MAKDPVCGMEVDPKTSGKVEYQGQTYYFCSPGCMATFQKDPGKYISGQMGGAHQGSHQGEHRH